MDDMQEHSSLGKQQKNPYQILLKILNMLTKLYLEREGNAT